ncbi:hypothetical protein JTE90_004591 [Oedothorax gibbosus]|uniref:TMC domain-containing protein n=1 Tax=Oedothorax gibbosus TaxID=931172 RepID=A0AAV6UL88_9ARAC|nr:hypothetical protein JTE90_004591 [Oedothorax gibbosus]
MEPSYSNEESQFLSVDGTSDESHIRKVPKKTSSVRFAPDVTLKKPRLFEKDGDLKNLTEEDIKTEICSCLPSNTLGRKRLHSFKSEATRASTFPRPSVSDEEGIPLSRLRHRSFVCNRKPSFMRSLGRLSSKRFPYESEQDYDSTDALESCLTEEERRDELLNIRNIPVRLSEKKKYRKKNSREFASDVSYERKYDDRDLQSKVHRYSRYDKSSYPHMSSLSGVSDDKNLPSRKRKVGYSERDSFDVKYKEDSINQRDINPHFSDERHGARRKDFYRGKSVEYDRSRSIDSLKDKSNIYGNGIGKGHESSDLPMITDKMHRNYISPERYFGVSEKEIPFSKNSYYNTALNIDENIPTSSRAEIKGLPYNNQSYFNNATSINRNNMQIDPDEGGFSYERKNLQHNKDRSGFRDSTLERQYERHQNRNENINSQQHRYVENYELYKKTKQINGQKESSKNVSKKDVEYDFDRFGESHLVQRQHRLKHKDFAFGNQSTKLEKHQQFSRGCKGDKAERNVNIRTQGIEMQTLNHDLPRESLNMHDAFVIGNVMLEQKTKKKTIFPKLQFMLSENGTRLSQRQCWSKCCFSLSKHSHISSKYDAEKIAVQNREAILETLPIDGPKDKSFWSKVKDSCYCLKRISSAFEIWNGTLKSIEGQHGTGVVSYFVFLRWLIAVNMILLLLYLLFVTLPHAVFVLLPLKDITTAPNHTLIDDKFLDQISNPPKRTKPKMERTTNYLGLSKSESISYLGPLLNDNLLENTIDIALDYDRKNLTTKERHSISRYCEGKYAAEMQNRTSGILDAMQDLLQGTGWLQSTILFLGYYSPNEISYFGLPYPLPAALIFVLFISFLICLGMMIQYSSHGVQETILARKSNYLSYSNLLFCSWDYCIEDKKSSIIRHNSILHEMKSTLNEERRKREIKEWSKGKKFQVYFLRGFINLFVICILCGSYYLIYRVVNYQLKEQQLHRLNNPGVNTLFVQYLTPIVITSLNIFVPIIFTNIVKFEMYNTQTQINMALFRIVFLRLSSIFVLVGLLYNQIICQPQDMCGSGITATCRSPICWETYVGQQFYKLAVTDFIVYIVMFIIYDFPRDVIVRRFNNKVCQIIGRQTFDLPNQVLALVYSQTLCWLGIIYSPLLPVITMIKFVIVFYIKKVMVLKYCIPAPIPYKASRSNAMFMIILMLSFITLMIIHGYSVSNIEPSAACSPFRFYSVMVEAVPDAVFYRSPAFAFFINFFFSPLFLFPAILLMCIAIYYYWTISIANRKMGKVLKAQIMLEGRDKQFLLNRLTEVAKGHI